MVGDPVAGEDDGVARDRAPAAASDVLQLDSLHPLTAEDAHDPRLRGHRDAKRETSGNRECSVGLRRAVCGGHQHWPAPGFAQREGRRPADELGSDDDRAGTWRAAVQVDEVLKLPGRVHPGGPVAGDQASGAWAFAGAGGQEDHSGADMPAPLGTGDLDGPIIPPAGDHRPCADVGPGSHRVVDQAARIGGAGDERSQVADAIAEVVTVARDAASGGFAVEHKDRAADARREARGGGQASRSTTDDQHVSGDIQ